MYKFESAYGCIAVVGLFALRKFLIWLYCQSYRISLEKSNENGEIMMAALLFNDL